MHFWLALRRLLPLLAVLSLALTPVTAPAAIAGLHAPVLHDHDPVTDLDHGMTGMDHAHMAHHDAGSGDRAGMDMDDMPCCPHEPAAKPDCTKTCPLMALCLATVAPLLPAAVVLTAPIATRASLPWPAAAAFHSVPGTPLPEPPRA
ncbi:hypothetical protein MKK88_17320 [Methylobacterium sp. E-005]|uniref:hypothetical protein n=1 Tax=Methylobacterium sp. E-005 TaxID=2836549 RepID=UPI001FB932BC|nr:hypothetical protein [Methylobacterium sp. E-005]MCJ2087729.1 hypothetical protein [Methylobacterium sp. E-005]